MPGYGSMGLPINPIVNGMMRGLAIGQMLRQAAFEDEERKRREWLDQAADMEMKERVLSAGRPVQGGVVEDFDKVSYPGQPETQMHVPSIRPADKTRTMKYKGRDGETIEVERYTPQERQQIIREQRRQQLEDETEFRAAAQRKQALRDLETYGVSINNDMARLLGVKAGTRVLPQQLDDLIRAQASLEKIRGSGGDPVVRTQTSVDDNGVMWAVPIHESGKTGEPARVGRVGKAKSPPGGGAGGSTPNERINREAKRQAMRMQEQIDKLQAQEDKLHAQKREIGAKMREGVYDDQEAKAAKAKLSALDGEIADMQKRKADLVQRKQGLGGRGTGSGGALSPAAEAYLKKLGLR